MGQLLVQKGILKMKEEVAGERQTLQTYTKLKSRHSWVTLLTPILGTSSEQRMTVARMAVMGVE